MKQFSMWFPANKDSARPETGRCAMKDDWPGVFIRGDDSYHFSKTLKRVLETNAAITGYDREHLEELIFLLESSHRP